MVKQRPDDDDNNMMFIYLPSTPRYPSTPVRPSVVVVRPCNERRLTFCSSVSLARSGGRSFGGHATLGNYCYFCVANTTVVLWGIIIGKGGGHWKWHHNDIVDLCCWPALPLLLLMRDKNHQLASHAHHGKNNHNMFLCETVNYFSNFNFLTCLPFCLREPWNKIHTHKYAIGAQQSSQPGTEPIVIGCIIGWWVACALRMKAIHFNNRR